MSNARDALKQALKDTIRVKPYAKITVADLCKLAGVSRRTFYNNFDSIDAIVDVLVFDIFAAPSRNLRTLLPVDDIKSAVILMLEMSFKTIYENRDFCRGALHYRGQYSLLKGVVQHVRALNREVYVIHLGDTEENEFVSYLFAGMAALTILWWIETDGEIEPATMAKYIDRWTFANWHTLEQNRFEQGKGDR